MTVYLTADQHYGHVNIIRFCGRPFRNVDEMDRTLIERHNATVGPHDLVWHLGDFAMGDWRAHDVIKALNGVHCLVAGNHDKPFRSGGLAPVEVKRYRAFGFRAIERHIMTAMEDVGNVLLVHRPFEAREFVLNANVAAVFHGHVHDRFALTPAEDGRPPMANVGVDVWDFRPVHVREVMARIEAR